MSAAAYLRRLFGAFKPIRSVVAEGLELGMTADEIERALDRKSVDDSAEETSANRTEGEKP